MIAALVVALLVQGGAPERAASVTARITPEEPAIGEAITVEVRVRAPAGSEVRFPALPDSLERLEALDPRAIQDASTRNFVDRTAIYRVIAFDTGTARMRLGDVTITRDGATRRHPVNLPGLRIRSVLPADSTGRVPRPPRAFLEVTTVPWRWMVALVVIAVLAYWGWREWRASRAARLAAGPEVAERAVSGFAHARALNLLDAGEHGRHALAHVAVLRRYLSDRFPAAALSLTAAELDPILRGDGFPVLPDRALEVLARAESIAFAHAPATAADAEAIAVAAVSLVRDVETALHARWARQEREDAGRRRFLRRRA